MNLSEIAEAFRKSLVDVLVPEIRLLREDTNNNFAKMDERFNTMQKSMDERFNTVQKSMDERFTKMDERFTKMDERFTKMDERFSKMDERFNTMQKSMDERFTKMDERLEKLFEIVIETRSDVKKLETNQQILNWLMTRVSRLEENVENIMHKLAA